MTLQHIVTARAKNDVAKLYKPLKSTLANIVIVESIESIFNEVCLIVCLIVLANLA